MSTELPPTPRKPSARSLKRVQRPPTIRKPSARSGPADLLRSSLRCGACRSGVPGPRLALSVHRKTHCVRLPSPASLRSAGLQARTAPQPCPSPGREGLAFARPLAPGRAVRSGSEIRRGLGGAERHLLRERRSHERRAGPRVGRGSRSRAPPWRERCSGVPGGLKGRGGVGEARTRKHRNEVRSAA